MISSGLRIKNFLCFSLGLIQGKSVQTSPSHIRRTKGVDYRRRREPYTNLDVFRQGVENLKKTWAIIKRRHLKIIIFKFNVNQIG